MRIGIDFDNTIACYDGVFHAAALERGLIPEGVGTDKNSVRDHLNGSGQKEAFTELQGYVYGSRMDLAKPFTGVAEFIVSALAGGHELFICSHKTRHPMLGPKHDMHDAARGFLLANNLVGNVGINPANVYFEITKEEKMERAASLGVQAFVDDLPDILAMPQLDNSVIKILFDPNGQHVAETHFSRVDGWPAIAALLLAQAA